jgi:hypothetical protein
MSLPIRPLRLAPSVALLAATVVFSASGTSLAQNSGVDLALHANSNASAVKIGLPAYPGAAFYKDADNDSAADLGLTINEFHFSLLAANYLTSDSPEKVLSFYRKPLSRYGEVLECNQGNPVGTLKVTRSGLTCGQGQGNGDGKVNANSSSGHEIRAGSPNQFRIVGIDDSHSGATRFGLVYLELPKESGEKTK